MSTNRARIYVVVLLALGLALPRCKTAAPGATSAGLSPTRVVLGAPLRRALTVEAARGRVEGRDGDGRWRRLQRGRAVVGLTALRSDGRGAMLTLSGAGHAEAGRLWLRGGTELGLGRGADGALRVLLVKGEARVSLFDPGLRAVLLQRVESGDIRGRTITGQDVLARKVGGTRDAVVPTALEPSAADWALAMLDKQTGESGVGSLSVGAGRPSLELRQVKVEAFSSGDVAETRVEHVFYNDSDQQLEGTFRFPLPEEAALIGLAMEINGRMMEGELAERNKARETYESIVDAMQDPALLEWEQGNTFKLRVFPIEARSTKRIVLRYVAPLERSADGLAYRYDTAAAEMQRRIPRFSLTVDGRPVVDAREFAPGRSVTAPVVDVAAGLALRELRGDGIYTALRLRPDWSRLPRPPKSRTLRDLLLIVDTSRSALESRKLCLQTARALLDSLRPGDRFLVLAADLTVRGHAAGFSAAGKEEARRALQFLEGIEPDGASDLGLALRSAGERLARRGEGEHRRAQVVYLGDGTATWGETEPAALERIAAESLGQTPLHAAILGKGADARVLRRLAALQGGRAVRPRTRRQVQHLALRLDAPAAPRLRQLRIRAGEHEQLFPEQAPTLFYGEELTVLMRTPADRAPARQVVVEGLAGDAPFVQTFAATTVAPARYVAHRWAERRLEQLEREGAPKEALVKHSLQYGVMSRHTAFLVLESEEAYRRYQIARKNAATPTPAPAPSVTGGDLESLGQARASLSPDHFQPGDPEVRIPAPADARSVVVVFPFGETKVASYEPALKAWTVRFLVSQDTPDGTYQITVRITHRDGQVELMRLSYVVDTKAPTVRIGVRRVRGQPAAYVISARQIVTQHELVQEARRDQIAGGAVTLSDSAGLRRYASVVRDASRVEVQLPGGRVLRLWPCGGGIFASTWRPRAALTGEVTLKVVAVDIANNRSVFEATFDPATGEVSR